MPGAQNIWENSGCNRVKGWWRCDWLACAIETGTHVRGASLWGSRDTCFLDICSFYRAPKGSPERKQTCILKNRHCFFLLLHFLTQQPCELNILYSTQHFTHKECMRLELITAKLVNQLAGLTHRTSNVSSQVRKVWKHIYMTSNTLFYSHHSLYPQIRELTF